MRVGPETAHSTHVRTLSGCPWGIKWTHSFPVDGWTRAIFGCLHHVEVLAIRDPESPWAWQFSLLEPGILQLSELFGSWFVTTCLLNVCLFLIGLFLFIWLCQVLVLEHGIFNLHCDMWDLVPWPGVEPRSPALGALSLSHWPPGESPVSLMFIFYLISPYWPFSSLHVFPYELPYPLARAGDMGKETAPVWQNSRRHHGLTLKQSLQQVWVLVIPWNVSDFPGGASG